MPIADWLSYPPPCKIAKQWKWIGTKISEVDFNRNYFRKFHLVQVILSEKKRESKEKMKKELL